MSKPAYWQRAYLQLRIPTKTNGSNDKEIAIITVSHDTLLIRSLG